MSKIGGHCDRRGPICDGMVGKGAASFGGELMAFHRDANLIEQHFGSKSFHDMERQTLMQAVRHGLPVDVILGFWR